MSNFRPALLAVTLLACMGGVDPASAQEAEAAVAAAAEPASVPAAVAETSVFGPAVVEAIGTPSEGKALVVFFRPSKFAGGAVSFIVRENDSELGKLRSGNYFIAQVEPGAHTYTVHSEAKDVTTVEVEAGETYFMTGSITMGFMAGRPNLAPSEVTAFEAALPKLKKSKPLE